MKELKFLQVWPEKMGEWAGGDTWFSEKVVSCMHFKNKIGAEINPFLQNRGPFIEYVIAFEGDEKLHAIESGKKYKAGDIAKPISVSPDGKEFQFAPELKIVSVQDIEISYDRKSDPRWAHVVIGGVMGIIFPYLFINEYENTSLEAIVENDGFESIDQFFQYFNEDFEGQILHFTDLRY